MFRCGDVTLKRLLHLTRKSLREQNCFVSLKSVKLKTIEPGFFYTEAYYYNNASDEEHMIEVIVNHHFSKDHVLPVAVAREILVQIYDATLHELRHRYQYRTKQTGSSFDDSSNFEAYLKDPDEVDAYAVSIAVELLRHLPKTRVLTCMKRYSALAKVRQYGVLISPSLHSYVSHFSSNPRILNKLMKRVYQHVIEIDPQMIFR